MQLGEMKTEERLPFTNVAQEEIREFSARVANMLNKAVAAFEYVDKDLAAEVVAEDDEIDEQEKMLRNKHIERINTKLCHPSAGVIYLDLLSNLERVADHAKNIAELVLEEQ